MNKLKGSSNAVKMKHLIIIFAVSLVVALPLRVYQLIALVNPESGFYDNSDFSVPILYGVAAVFTVLITVFCFISKSIPSPEIKIGKNPILGIASLLAAGGMAWDVITIETRLIPQTGGYVNADMFRSLFSVYLEENGGAFLLAELLFAVLSVFYFIVFAVSHFEGKPHYKKLKLLALSPLCWSMAVLVSKLTKAISFMKVSELLFEIFMFVFVMLFFLTFARICSGVFTENSMWGVFGYGFASAFFGALVTVPRLVVLFAGLNPVENYEFNISYFAVVVFVIAFVLSAMGIGFKHGLKNIKAVSELELPDDKDVVVKGSDVAYVSDFAEEDEVSENSKKNAETVIESVLEYEIEEALDDYFEEMEAGTVVRKTVDSKVSEPEVFEAEVEEKTEEPETFEVEVGEETQEPETFEAEVEEESVEEFFEEEKTEKNGSDENFVEFSEMLIDDTDDFDDITEPEPVHEKAVVPEKEKSSFAREKEKKKVAKKENSKQRKKNKKDSGESEEPIKIVSLADLKKKSE